MNRALLDVDALRALLRDMAATDPESTALAASRHLLPLAVRLGDVLGDHLSVADKAGLWIARADHAGMEPTTVWITDGRLGVSVNVADLSADRVGLPDKGDPLLSAICDELMRRGRVFPLPAAEEARS